MAVSGVTVQDAVVTEFNKIKLNKAYRYIVFKLTDDLKEIEVDRCEPPDAKFDDFAQSLPKDDCRYAIYDFEFELGDAGKRQQLVLVVWCPDTAKIKKKMLYASSKDAVKKKLLGLNHEIQATDRGELSYDDVKEQVQRKAIK